jgi:hypothetical protein
MTRVATNSSLRGAPEPMSHSSGATMSRYRAQLAPRRRLVMSTAVTKNATTCSSPPGTTPSVSPVCITASPVSKTPAPAAMSQKNADNATAGGSVAVDSGGPISDIP